MITEARTVVASIPGVAQWFSGLRDPRLMGVLTLLAGGLVTWAFWPRRVRKAATVADPGDEPALDDDLVAAERTR